jgi:hypothetical protein
VRPLRELAAPARRAGDNMRVLVIIGQLANAAAWRGVAEQERAVPGAGSRRADLDTGRCFVCLLHPRQRIFFAGGSLGKVNYKI